jgi:hypothetical protein
MNGPALSAAERIEKFCDEWPRMRGLDSDLVYAIQLGDEREAAITLTDLRSLLADLRAARGEVESLTRERDALRQDLWDVFGIQGGDQDGDPTPIAMRGDLGKLVRDQAREMREMYDECPSPEELAASQARVEVLTSALKTFRSLTARMVGIHNGDYDELVATAAPDDVQSLHEDAEERWVREAEAALAASSLPEPSEETT